MQDITQVTHETDRSIYRLNDLDKGPAIATTWREAKQWNEKGWGIFWTVQKFKTHDNRKVENLERILSWAVDLDVGTHEEQAKRIKKFIEPSMVIKTKRGFHVYYNARNATPERFSEIMEDHIVPNLLADRNAKDLARILRVPHYYHRKDPAHPSICELLTTMPVSYTEEQIKNCFPKTERQEQVSYEKKVFKREMKKYGAESCWERIWDLDCEDALMRISGTAAMGHEVVTFKRAPRGCLNIQINGKGTSCWVDAQKKIGSADKGGPGIAQWINWYHKDYRTTLKYIREFFPEVFHD